MKTIILVIVLSTGFCTIINAQSGRNVSERKQDQQEIATNNIQLERDQKELIEFRASYEKWKWLRIKENCVKTGEKHGMTEEREVK